MLKNEAKRNGSPLNGFDKIINYLQKLGMTLSHIAEAYRCRTLKSVLIPNLYIYQMIVGEQYLKLIFKFSAWVLKESPDNGLMVSIYYYSYIICAFTCIIARLEKCRRCCWGF